MRVLARRSVSLVAVLLLVAPAIGQSTRPTVAVLDFDFGSIQKWWSGYQDLGTGIAALIVDESGSGGGASRAAGGSLDFRASDFKDTIIGEATEQAVKTLSKALISKKDRLN